MALSAVLFDLDGVLVEARPWHRHAFLQAAKLCGYTISERYHDMSLEALATRQKLAHLEAAGLIEAKDCEKISDLKKVLTRTQIEKNLTTDLKLVLMLEKLRRARVPIGLCTNSVTETAELILTKMGIRKFFETIVSNENVLKPKPDPEMFHLAASLIGVQISQCLIVEDSEVGIRAAKLSGARWVHVKSPNDLLFRQSQIFSEFRIVDGPLI